MNYVYPKFPGKEIFDIRIGGPGLGNLLFIYARAFKFAKENNCKFIWPVWKSLKIGTWLRLEKDKRFYANLFKNNADYISGKEKRKILKTFKHVKDETFDKNADNQVVIFDKYIMDYEYFIEYRDEIYDDLKKNLKERNKNALEFDFSNSISVHVRLGDFLKANENALKNGSNNMSIPVIWYANTVKQIRKIVGKEIKVYVFSDGKDKELEELLSLPNVERISFGTSIADIMALSRAKLFIASGSTFSSWARFLGGMSTITYINQLKCKCLCKDGNFEIELENNLENEEISEKIRLMYKEN